MLRKFLLGAALLLAASPFCFGQGARIGDNFPISTALTVPGVISTSPFALINICTYPANGVPCTNKATTYTSITLGTPCSTSTQVVLHGTSTCVADTDLFGNWGAWVAPGTYDFTITVTGGQSLGPFTITAGPLSVNQINTFTAQQNFSAGISTTSLNKIVFADQQAGSTADVKIANCLAALSGAEGTCDARGFGNSIQSIAAAVTIGQYQTLVFDPATFFQPATASVNMFFGSVNSHIKGLSADLGNLTANTWTGCVISYTGNYGNGNNTSFEDIAITASTQTTSGNGICITSNVATFISGRHVRILGTNAGLVLQPSGTGFINGNHFSDIVITGSPNGYFIKALTPAEVNGNICSECSFEQGGVASTGIVMTGTGPIQNNTFAPMHIWDTVGGSNPITISNTQANNNLFIGRFDGTITDATNSNTYIDNLHNLLTVPTLNGLFGKIVRSPTFVADQGVACTNGELVLSGGWQSTGVATVTGVNGNGQTCSWVITTGTTTAASPTVTDTLTNPLPDAVTVCELNIHGGTHTPAAGEGFSQSALSGTAPVFTFNGTPTAGGLTYFVTRRCGP